MSQHQKNKTAHKILKTAAIVLAGLAGLILVAVVVLFFMAEPMAERYLKKQVAQQTDSLYQLEFSELQLHPFTLGLSLQNLHLHPDTAVLRQQKAAGEAPKNLLQLKAAQAEVSGLNVLALLLSKRLKLADLTLNEPQITHTRLPDAMSSSDRNSGNGGGSRKLKSIRIREINLENGSYSYLEQGTAQPLRHNIPQLTLQVQDLRLDSLGQPGLLQRLSLDGVEATAKRYAYHSPNQVYTIRAGLFTYSTSEQELQAKKVNVQADQQANRALPAGEAHHTLFRVEVPVLRLTGMDIGEAFRSKQLMLDRFLLEEPALEVLEDATVPQKKKADLQELYTNLAPYLKRVGIEEFQLADGSFRYNQLRDTLYTVHHLEQANLTVQDVLLDSASLFTPQQKPFADEVLLAVQAYTYSPLHRLYYVTTGNIKLSTRAQSLRAADISVTADWDRNRRLRGRNRARRTFYDITVPVLEVQDMDLFQALRTSRLAIGNIAIKNPSVGVRTDQRVPEAGKGLNLQEMYEQVSDYITSLAVAKISVSDASFTHHSRTAQVQRLQQLEQATVVATGLEIDSSFIYKTQKVLPLDELVLTAQEYVYRLPDNTYIFTLGSLRYSTRQQVLTARSIDIKSSTEANQELISSGTASRNLYDLTASRFKMTGVDIIKALNTGKLTADKIILLNPELAILLDRNIAASPTDEQQYRSGLFQIVNPITANTLVLEDGTFIFREKRQEIMVTHVLQHASATVEELYLAPSVLTNMANVIPMQEVYLTAENYIYRSADSLYTITLDSLHYSSHDQELIARSFTVNSSEKVNERLKKQDRARASHNLFDVTAQKFRLTGFDLIQAYATGHYSIKKMLLREPEIRVLQDRNVPPRGQKGRSRAAPAPGTEPRKDAMEQIANIVETFRVERLEVTDGTFTFDRLDDTIKNIVTVPHVGVVVDKLRLVSLRAADPLDMFAADDMGVVVRNYTFRTPDGLYVLNFNELRSSLKNSSLTLKDFRMVPLFSKEAYDEVFEYAQDRVELYVPFVELQNINMRALFNRQHLVVQKMLVKQPEMEIYRDNSIGIDPERRTKTLQQKLMQTDLYIRFDTIEVEDGRIVHPIIAINANEPGVLLLTDIQMQLLNVTNDSSIIKQNNVTTVYASTKFMGKGDLQAHFRFQLDHPESRYTYEGSMGPMDFTAFNPLIAPMMFVRVEEGQIDKATFYVEATADVATGMVYFYYHDLEVQLLNKNDPGNRGLLLKVGTFLVNALVIKSNNPTRWGNFRKGKVKEPRNKQRAIFQHMGQALLNGISSSLMPAIIEKLVITITGGI